VPNDQEVVLAALEQDGRALQFASEGLKAYQYIILAAVRKNGLALKHAPAFQTDKEVVFQAVWKNCLAL
jgi:hypothetical protein